MVDDRTIRNRVSLYSFAMHCAVMTYIKRDSSEILAPRVERSRKVDQTTVEDDMSTDPCLEAFITCHYKDERLRSLGVLQ